jgi:tryptophan synthase alpha chain
LIDRLKNLRNIAAGKRSTAQNEALLIGYFMACDPDFLNSLHIIKEAVSAGIDILEIGVPSLNPVLDGDIIRRSHERVMKKGEYTNIVFLRFLEKLRSEIDVPVWVMGYRHDLLEGGFYAELARRQLIDGIVLPDCSLTVLNQIDTEINRYGIDVIRFVHPFMNDLELETTVANASIIYVQLYQGTTGDPMIRQEGIEDIYRRIRKISSATVLAGFGIRTPGKVRSMVNYGFDGVVVGSAFVARLESGAIDSLYRLVSDMKVETARMTEPQHEGENHGIHCGF